MNTYAIRREKAWQSPAELGATAERSKEVAASEWTCPPTRCSRWSTRWSSGPIPSLSPPP